MHSDGRVEKTIRFAVTFLAVATLMVAHLRGSPEPPQRYANHSKKGVVTVNVMRCLMTTTVVFCVVMPVTVAAAQERAEQTVFVMSNNAEKIR